jgi:tRNA pseudouridine38-40 synthase
MRYKITIEYDGTNYLGWAGSIDRAIEIALLKLTGENVRVYGSGRTDTGVHAMGQVAHFDLNKEFTTKNVITGTNHFLNKNNDMITIVECEMVQNDFHARFSAIKRRYMYRILNREQPSTLDKNRVWHIHKPLNLNTMQECLPLLVGKKDWSCFRASDCQSKSPIKTIDKVDLLQNGNEIIFTIEAKSFLYHQVRNIVGTLVDVGLEKKSVKNFEDIILSKNRSMAGKTAFSGGLYFTKVEY